MTHPLISGQGFSSFFAKFLPFFDDFSNFLNFIDESYVKDIDEFGLGHVCNNARVSFFFGSDCNVHLRKENGKVEKHVHLKF